MIEAIDVTFVIGLPVHDVHALKKMAADISHAIVSLVDPRFLQENTLYHVFL